MVKISMKGGFLHGVAYGLLLSIVSFIALAYAFPIATGTPAPNVAEVAQIEPQSLELASTENANAGVVIGGSGDSNQIPVMQAPLAGEQPFQAPVVVNQSAARPNIGQDNENSLVNDNSTETATDPVVVTVGADNVASNNTPPVALQPLVTGSAIEVFSVSYNVVPGKQLMAIILEDTLEENLAELLNTGAMFSFAIPANTQDPNAGQAFRELGYEVLAMIPDDIPDDGNYTELFGSYIQNVPVSVALIDNSLVSILRDEAATAALIEVVAQSGHGAVSFAGAGDARARGFANAAGVPFGTVTRIVDTDPDPVSIRKALDQALLAALTSGSAIVYARTRESTISTLISWLNSSRLESIQIVPASVILQR